LEYKVNFNWRFILPKHIYKKLIRMDIQPRAWSSPHIRETFKDSTAPFVVDFIRTKYTSRDALMPLNSRWIWGFENLLRQQSVEKTAKGLYKAGEVVIAAMQAIEMVDEVASRYCAYPQLTVGEEEARKPELERKYLEEINEGLRSDKPVLDWHELGVKGVYEAIVEEMEKKVDGIEMLY
jgi:hypothetical protein